MKIAAALALLPLAAGFSQVRSMRARRSLDEPLVVVLSKKRRIDRQERLVASMRSSALCSGGIDLSGGTPLCSVLQLG